jgi:ATP/maltotriose-dependent transcriptional regulator MalT
MNADEARAVLARRQHRALPELVALAKGWPAVIGLAALGRGERVTTGEIPTELYEFFAEEVYLGLSDAAQQDIAALALAPAINDLVASTVLGARAQDTLHEAVVAGFLTRREAGYEFHPLLRDFINRRVSPPASPESLGKLVDLYLQHSAWDDAFVVAVTADDALLAERVIEHALDDLLNNGRLETLVSWIARVPAGFDPAVLELAEAELAFRNARHERAFVLATRAAAALPEGHPLRARAFLCAGQSAYFSDHTAEGRTYSETAAELAQSGRERANALWLRFTASMELEDPALARILEAFEKARTDDPDDVVRAVCGHLIIDIRFGEDPEAPRHAEGVRGLVDRVVDPIVKTSFLNAFGRSLALRGFYDEAIAVFKAGEEVASQTGLDFALPHIMMARAAAELSRGRLTRAGELLRRGEEYATDANTRSNGLLVRSKLLLAGSRPRQAEVLLARFREEVHDRATRAELDAYRGLANAIAGDPDQAHDLATRARATSRTIEPTVVANLVSGMVNNWSTSGYLEEAVTRTASAGHVDLLVVPLRSSPQLRDLVAALPVREGVVEEALAKSDPRSHTSPLGSLSPREHEVLALVAEGLSNRAIAGRLFISDVTVKVHVRHIFEKLGVRSRTEAVVVALDSRVKPPPPR